MRWVRWPVTGDCERKRFEETPGRTCRSQNISCRQSSRKSCPPQGDNFLCRSKFKSRSEYRGRRRGNRPLKSQLSKSKKGKCERLFPIVPGKSWWTHLNPNPPHVSTDGNFFPRTGFLLLLKNIQRTPLVPATATRILPPLTLCAIPSLSIGIGGPARHLWGRGLGLRRLVARSTVVVAAALPAPSWIVVNSSTMFFPCVVGSEFLRFDRSSFWRKDFFDFGWRLWAGDALEIGAPMRVVPFHDNTYDSASLDYVHRRYDYVNRWPHLWRLET
jgi:hypothetical protein